MPGGTECDGEAARGYKGESRTLSPIYLVIREIAKSLYYSGVPAGTSLYPLPVTGDTFVNERWPEPARASLAAGSQFASEEGRHFSS